MPGSLAGHDGGGINGYNSRSGDRGWAVGTESHSQFPQQADKRSRLDHRSRCGPIGGSALAEKRMLTFDMNISEPLPMYDKQVSDVRNRRTYVDSFASFRASVPKGKVSVPEVPLGEPLATECAHFLECIVTGKQPFSGGREGSAVVRALEAMQRSIRGGGQEEQVEPC
jgi:hypothetical protein